MSRVGDFGTGIGLYFACLFQVSALSLACVFLSLPTIVTNRMESRTVALNETAAGLDNNVGGLARAVWSFSLSASSLGHSDIATRWDIIFFEIGLAVVTLFAVLRYNGLIRKITQRLRMVRSNAAVCTLEVLDPPPDLEDPQAYVDHFNEVVQVENAVTHVVLRRNTATLLQLSSEIQHAKRRIRCIDEEEGEQHEAVRVMQPHERPGLFRKMLWALGHGRSRLYYRWIITSNELAIRAMRGREKSSARHRRIVRAYVEFKTRPLMLLALERTQHGSFSAYMMGESSDGLSGRKARVAHEASDIMWEVPLVNKSWSRLTQLLSNCITWAILAASFAVLYVLQSLRNGDGGAGSSFSVSVWDSAGPALLIASLNSAIPNLVRWVVMVVESHTTHSGMQKSMMSKTTFTRVMATSIIPFLATPSRAIVSEMVLQRLQSVLVAGFFMNTVVRLLDPKTFFLRYLWSRTAQTQVDMNDAWGGVTWHLSDRFTEMLATLSIAMVFGTLIPTAYWIAACTFVVTYWIDKHLLFRQWKVAPSMNSDMARTATRTIVILLIIRQVCTAWTLDSWPQDGVASGVTDADQQTVWEGLRERLTWGGQRSTLSITLLCSASLLTIAWVVLYFQDKITTCWRNKVGGHRGAYQKKRVRETRRGRKHKQRGGRSVHSDEAGRLGRYAAVTLAERNEMRWTRGAIVTGHDMLPEEFKNPTFSISPSAPV